LNFSGGSERGSWGEGTSNATESAESVLHLQRRFLPPHLNPLPRCGGEVGLSARLVLNKGALSRATI
jgi:hypothetical protein